MNYHQHFSFELPTRIEFGIGLIESLAEHVLQLGGKRVLLVSDKGLVAAGVVGRVVDILTSADLDTRTFTEVEPEPEAAGVTEGAKICNDDDRDIIIAVGGGSALDTGKSIALMARNAGHIRDYAGLEIPSSPGLPVIAIPTTAGTGSECAVWSVISEKDQNIKYGVGGRNMTATVALCDPTLSVSLPARLTVGTGLDALTHALESYVNKATQPISEALSEKSMELISRSLRTAVFNGADVQARADMLLASTMAACAFAPTRLGLAHAMAMPLGAKAKIPHGDVISILLPEVMRFNVNANLAKFARIASIFDVDTRPLSLREAAHAGVDAVAQLIADIGAPNSLAAYGVQESDLDALAEESMESGNIVVNPRPATAADLVDIMRKCL